MNQISCKELQRLIRTGESFRLIDVRGEDEWHEGHIASAELLPLSLLDMLAAERLPDKHEPIIICCATGGRATLAASTLMKKGYTHVSVLTGGYCAWQETTSDPVLCAGGVVVRYGDDGRTYVALEQQAARPEWDSTIWFIPKGHVEGDESLEAAARREIAEEAGVHEATLIQHIGVKQRVGSRSGELKEIHYFLFETTQEKLQPTATDKPHIGAWFDLSDDIQLGFEEQQEILEEVRTILDKKE